ncbi:MAG: MBL fold metallo-hydrolase [Lentisphaerae bacterium]|nr:MBL fold metallo-hydrolase [Lentisphaerota bacterium]
MNMFSLCVGPFEVNCWIVWAQPPQALVIDPGSQAEAILERLRKHELHVAAYLITHGHMDHIGALFELHQAMPAPVCIHAADARWAFSESNQMPPHYPQPQRPPGPFRTPESNKTFQDAGLEYRALFTPGHSPGGVCYYFPTDKTLFSGDTLFQGTVGRTDLPGGDARTLSRSLQVLAGLPPDTRVFPGHGSPTTLAKEKRGNPFFKTMDV